MLCSGLFTFQITSFCRDISPMGHRPRPGLTLIKFSIVFVPRGLALLPSYLGFATDHLVRGQSPCPESPSAHPPDPRVSVVPAGMWADFTRISI